MYAHDCSEQIENKFAESGDIDSITSAYKASIPFGSSQELPLGKLSKMIIPLEDIDYLSAKLLSDSKTRVASEHLSLLIIIRKATARIYCLIAKLFDSEDAIDKISITYSFVIHDLRIPFSLINESVKFLISEGEKPKPKLDKILPSFSEASLDKLAEVLSSVVPGNQISELRKMEKTSLTEADLKILLELKQRCDEIGQFFDTIWGVFTDSESKVTLY